VQFVDFLNQIQ